MLWHIFPSHLSLCDKSRTLGRKGKGDGPTSLCLNGAFVCRDSSHKGRVRCPWNKTQKNKGLKMFAHTYMQYLHKHCPSLLSNLGLLYGGSCHLMVKSHHGKAQSRELAVVTPGGLLSWIKSIASYLDTFLHCVHMPKWDKYVCLRLFFQVCWGKTIDPFSTLFFKKK